MAKAMLIVDMPSCCLECPCMNELDECVAMKNEDVGNVGRKPTWCPLREVPQKKKITIKESEYTNTKRIGYNACIDEILGGGE